MILPIIIVSVPAVIFGLLLEKKMDTVFRDSTVIVAVSLILGSILFYFAEKFAKYNSEISPKKGLAVGLFQCLALVPGFSRSGATISGGLLVGLNREAATRFSFLLALPVILGSGLLKLLEIIKSGAIASEASSIFWASLFAFVSGLLAIHFLIKFLRNHSLNYFGAYRIVLAVIILIWL